MPTPLLDIRHLSVVFDTEAGPLRAVNDVSITINAGETVGLVGESGCGKSVTSMSILRLIPRPPGRFAAGEIIFEGRDLLTLPIKELRKVRGNDISVIFQEPMTALSPLQRVGQQLVETIRVHRPETPKKEAWATGAEWLRKVGIPDPAERMFAYPFQLSGGMRQRVMIAMALMLQPKLIIADEPTTALDVTIQAQIFDLMLQMKAADTSLLLITHDMGVVWETCDRVVVMYATQVVEEGPVKDVFQRPLHPYTQGLMGAVPSLTGKRDRLTTIDGQVPSPLRLPTGCHFADRCPFVMTKCREAQPPVVATPAGGRVACFKAADDLAADVASGAVDATASE